MKSSTFNNRKTASAGRPTYIEVEPNVNLHITDLGEGPAVVLIPGYPLGNETYEYQYHTLIEAGYRVISITMRGFGLSDKPYGTYDFDVFADDIKVVLETLEIENAVLGGHSMGGAIALHFTAKYNGEHISKLALFSAATPRHTKLPDYDFPLFTKEDVTSWIELLKVDRPAMLGAVGSKLTLNADSLNAGIGAWLGASSSLAAPYAMDKALTALCDSDLRDDLPKINVPTIIFHAVDDAIVAYAMAQQLHQGIKDARLVTFEKSGHLTYLEETPKFNEEFLKFIKE
ncbi:alpha/beta hydrolase [Mucilaginibacter sp. RS28]|uniref:Alpha/beta hydrolase n=1 Tax=Mucilaginibacter straminoryzae TaxID=2932774 RepID=A0A9X1WZF8_9SPHI|nr:alpha/beta hydrolase [Mucilaginibacter straminoryzae]MCJ8208359.1 alpha/beta hydrolase [Mucilaginibacter straminoryzae]